MRLTKIFITAVLSVWFMWLCHDYTSRDADNSLRPDLQQRHLEQRKAMYYRNEAWTDDAVFRTGVFINSDESKVNLAASDGRRWVRRRRGHHVFAERSVQRHLAHGRAKVKVNIWGAIGPNGVSKLVRSVAVKG
ncbi:hypothetical protein GGX14DRAFT_390442 [Mycena pura]|uniref:Uncharacterized protein n=1 Tax=Mycena pura TaxID=153505 RepID=A0AAD6YGA2_9AGAR|nr:hypothetical protein GGX14DRAFT_395942 [Mycena pura]KAJ7218676.1 hypothetical protein GGX14DRAFT_390442 [Mycena pura]